MKLDAPELKMSLVAIFTPEMSLVLILLSAMYVVCVLVIARALLRAPEGFENELGYQPGRQPVDDDQSR
ncbi:MAG: hypothetical protein H2172_05030 [Opitutus sp.]|nr:hypothetical protein [Opitutus sp.]MCS6247292.1 hypothetical protein [Opitutus sp.]MCS6278963.1 hypothetical protein [Opitutus sp.]MCS6298712.1 hypothetical protein [Opitutus sp.]